MFSALTRSSNVTNSAICRSSRPQSVTDIISRCSFHTSQIMESKKAGRHKTSIKGDKPLTYEQANKPDMIGVRKSWNTFNTTGLIGGIRHAECVQEDVLIRKFVHGTWPKLLASDVIIKRRANQIVLSFMAMQMMRPAKMYFLIGYTEEILSYLLKCVVRLEVQTIGNESDLTYKFI